MSATLTDGLAAMAPAPRRLLMQGTVVATVLALAGLVAAAIDPRLLSGVSVWSKPVKFAVSIAALLGTIAWLWPTLPRAWQEGRPGRVAVACLIGASVVELAYIAARAGMGQRSHFNVGDPFSAAMYGVMGLLALLLVVVTAWMGAAILRDRDLTPVRRAAGWGLLLGGVLGGAMGIAISVKGAPWIGATPSNGAGWPLLGWARDGGDLRIAHFLGLHAMQTVPLAGWALARWAPRLAGPGLAVAAVGWTALVGWAFVCALRGLPPV